MLLWFTEGCNLRCKRRWSSRWWSLLSLDDSDHHDESKFEVKRPAANSLYIIILRIFPKLFHCITVCIRNTAVTTYLLLLCTRWYYGVVRWPIYSIKFYTVKGQTSILLLSNVEQNHVLISLADPKDSGKLSMYFLSPPFSAIQTVELFHGYEITTSSGTMSNWMRLIWLIEYSKLKW